VPIEAVSNFTSPARAPQPCSRQTWAYVLAGRAARVVAVLDMGSLLTGARGALRAQIFSHFDDAPLGSASIGQARPPTPSRTDWTRLVPPPVLTGHVSLVHWRRRAAQAPEAPASCLRTRLRAYVSGLSRAHS
jgi:hypothetical protein